MKWGIIATGRIARKFADTLNKMKEEGQELVAVASRSLDTAQAFAREYKIPKTFGSYEALAADSEIEAVYIATPNNLHYENTLLCLNNGKHVICEKPFTLRKNEAEELYELAQTKGLFLMEGMWISHLPALKKMQEWIKNGSIGDVKNARVDYGFALAPERRFRKFAPELGGGALWDIGVYNLSFLRMVFDCNPEVVDLEFHKNEYNTDDFSVVDLQYKDGARATAVTSIGVDLGRRANVYGTKGMIMLEDFQHAEKISLVSYDGKIEELEFPCDINGFEYQIREASDCVEKGLNSSPVYTVKASIETTGLLEELYKKIISP